MNMRQKIAKQFGQPVGIMGWFAGKIMLYRGSNRQRVEWAVSLLNLQPQDRVLEIGFGPGRSIELITRHVPKGSVAGIDHSELMVREARKRIALSSFSAGTDLRVASVDVLPDYGYLFDKVLAINSFQFWPHKMHSLSQIKARMKPGAVLALVIQPRSAGATIDTTKQVEEELFATLQEAGFQEVQSEWNHFLRPVPGVCISGKV